MPELFRAALNPAGPNFERWREILGTHLSVPLKSAYPIVAPLEGEGEVECYLVNLDALTLKQRARLFGFLSQKFQVPIFKIERELKDRGFPIRAVDVIVEISMRAAL